MTACPVTLDLDGVVGKFDLNAATGEMDGVTGALVAIANTMAYCGVSSMTFVANDYSRLAGKRVAFQMREETNELTITIS